MPILIDGHNLIGRLSTLSLQDPYDEEKLVQLLKSYHARTGKPITVVFDPGRASALSRRRREGGIEVVYASHASSADAIIARRVRRSHDPHGLIVVTSDQALGRTVTHHGARVRAAQDFASELSPPHSDLSDWKDVPPPPEEIEAWLALFEDQDPGAAHDDAS